MEIRKSTTEDLQEIMEIYGIARTFMKNTGNPTQWRNGYPSESLVRSDIESGISYVAVENGEIEAVFVFRMGEDPTYKVIEDGAWRNDAPYGVLHRIASRGRVKGIGSECIQWCFAQCGNLRGDTHADQSCHAACDGEERICKMRKNLYCGWFSADRISEA